MEWVTSIDWLGVGLALALGLMLSISAGLRVFLPLLILSGVGLFAPSLLPLPENLQWLASYLAFTTLLVATILEIAAFYIPAVASFLSWAATPLSFVAGALAMAVPLGAEGVDPIVQWTIAIAVGGGAATATNVATAGVRTFFATMTAGLSDVVTTTIESILALVTSLLWVVLLAIGGIAALLLTTLFLILFIFIMFRFYKKYRMRKRLRQTGCASTNASVIPNKPSMV